VVCTPEEEEWMTKDSKKAKKLREQFFKKHNMQVCVCMCLCVVLCLCMCLFLHVRLKVLCIAGRCDSYVVRYSI